MSKNSSPNLSRPSAAQLAPAIAAGGPATETERRTVSATDHSEPQRRCAHCERPLAVNPRLGKLHRYCSRAACAQASKRAAQEKWLQKWRNENGGKDYFSGKVPVAKLGSWGEVDSHFGKGTGPHGEKPPGAIRLNRKLKAALRDVALQDTIDTRLALTVGIISRLSGATLQGTIAKEIRAAMLRGYAILRGQKLPRPDKRGGPPSRAGHSPEADAPSSR